MADELVGKMERKIVTSRVSEILIVFVWFLSLKCLLSVPEISFKLLGS